MSGLVVMRRTAIAVVAALGVGGYIGAANAVTVDFSTLKDPPSSLTNYS